jgi:phosphonoacetaldehyde hydrolase
MLNQDMTKLKAVVLDWAGTVVDFGSFAPMGVFVEVFRQFGIDVTIAEARQPMGLPKWDHIDTMLRIPRVRAAWIERHGREPADADVDAIYRVFVPMNEEVVGRYATLVPGARDTGLALRERGLKVGSTTGYTRSIMQRVLPLAKEQGYEVDNLVCADDLPQGRPTPMNMYKCFLDLDVWPAHAVVKVDDTGVGIDEGVRSGCWTVGVALSGNEAGLTVDEYRNADPVALDAVRRRSTQALKAHGAHYVIDTVADLMPVIDDIERRVAQGQRPAFI